jgi:hypothetical protein
MKKAQFFSERGHVVSLKMPKTSKKRLKEQNISLFYLFRKVSNEKESQRIKDSYMIKYLQNEVAYLTKMLELSKKQNELKDMLLEMKNK